MKIKKVFASVLKPLRIAAGWILMALGGLLGGISALCAILALFGGLETESFGEQLGLFAAFLILMCVGICVLIEGRWIKNGTFGKKTARPQGQKAPKPKLPQPTEDQKRLEEIERNIDSVVGAIQANPMSPGGPANEELLKKLQQEKRARLKRIAAHLETISIQDAWNTFTPEQQKRFDAQVYQYSQDVGRGGLEREIAAANRGLVFVGHKPVPEEVADRLKELQEAEETPIDDFTDRIWDYRPTPGRPNGTVDVIKQLSVEERRDGAAFSYEKTIIKRDLVQVGDQLYLRITDYECSSGANGRPLYSLFESYHVLYLTDIQIALRLLTAESGLKYAAKSAAYRYEERDTGVLF